MADMTAEGAASDDDDPLTPPPPRSSAGRPHVSHSLTHIDEIMILN
jgi:hypothetical protein